MWDLFGHERRGLAADVPLCPELQHRPLELLDPPIRARITQKAATEA
jgi:hypothetical protein